MAIVNNFWLKNQRKRLAGAVIYQAMGQTRSRELATSVTNPRTAAQMAQRVRWSNCVNIYRVNSSWMKFAYETKKQNQTDYNKFMSLNVSSSYIYLTKQIASSGGCVAAPYIYTQGSLPSISWVKSINTYISNLYFGTLQPQFDDISVADFSRYLLEYNPGLREGDQLSFIFNFQQFNPDTGYPFVLLRKYEVLLDTSNTSQLSRYFPTDSLVIRDNSDRSCLSYVAGTDKGTFCMILSRTTGGKTFVSTQSSIVVNNEATIAQYSSEAARQAAINSYGEEEDIFLTTTSASDAPSADLPNQITAIDIDGVMYEAGANVPLVDVTEDSTIQLLFQHNVVGPGVSMILHTSLRRDVIMHVESVSDNAVIGEFTTDPTFARNEAIQSITVSLGQDSGQSTYEVSFFVRNEQTIGGLE